MTLGLAMGLSMLGGLATTSGCTECDNLEGCYDDCDEAHPKDESQRSLCYASCDQNQSDCNGARG